MKDLLTELSEEYGISEELVMKIADTFIYEKDPESIRKKFKKQYKLYTHLRSGK